MMKSFYRNLGLFGLAISLAQSVSAWDFLYVEHAIESTRLVQITGMGNNGQGSILLEDDCDACPDLLPYTDETILTTPFGSGRPINELAQWQGHPAMIYYSVPNHSALRIIVYSSDTDLSEE